MSLLKKVCSIVLVAAVVLTLFACVAYGSTFAAGGPTLTVADTKVDATDGAAAVKLSFASNGSDVLGLSFKVNFGTRLTAGQPGYELSDDVITVDNIAFDDGVAAFALFSKTGTAIADGTLVTLNFTLPNDIKGSEVFDITITDCQFSNGATVLGTTTDGKLTAVLYGDVDADGAVGTASDLLLLKQYYVNYDLETGTSTVTIDALAADVDCDGTGGGAGDLLLLKQYYVNFDPTTQTSTVVLGPTKEE